MKLADYANALAFYAKAKNCELAQPHAGLPGEEMDCGLNSCSELPLTRHSGRVAPS